MQITFLDSSTLTRGDIDFTPLKAFGTLTLHETTSPDETRERCLDADVLITNKVILSADLIAALPNLSEEKFLGLLRQLPSLEKLMCPRNEAMTDNVFLKLPPLNILNCSACPNLSEDVVKKNKTIKQVIR